MQDTPVDSKVIIAGKGQGIMNSLREIVRYKDLFYTLAYKDYRVRYAQTFLGLFWAFIQPAATLLIFFAVFHRAIQVDTGGIAYPLFAICGMSAWTYFAFVVKQNRFNPPVQAVKDLLDAGKLGEVLMVSVNCFWNRNADYYNQSHHGFG